MYCVVLSSILLLCAITICLVNFLLGQQMCPTALKSPYSLHTSIKRLCMSPAGSLSQRQVEKPAVAMTPGLKVASVVRWVEVGWMFLTVLCFPLTGRVRNLCSLGQSVMGHSAEEALCRPVRLRLTESHCTNNPLPFPSPGLTHLTRGPRRTPNWLKMMCRMRNISAKQSLQHFKRWRVS